MSVESTATRTWKSRASATTRGRRRPGHLFFSTARDATRNRANIDDALNRGARAVVVRGGDGGDSAPRGDPGRERAAAPADGRGRVALFRRAERARRSDRHHRHQRQDHDHLYAGVDFRSGRHARRDHRHDRNFHRRQENLQRTDDARVDRFRIRAGADGARGRAARGGGSFVDRNRRRARRCAELPRLHVHQPRPRPSGLSRRRSKITSPPSCGCSPRFCRAASARIRSRSCAATIPSAGACSTR